MADLFSTKIATYLDGELNADEMRAMDKHLRQCASCSADVAAQLQAKGAIKLAGARYSPTPDLRAKVQRQLVEKQPARRQQWLWVPLFAVLLIAIAVGLYLSHATNSRNQIYGELADLHIATLASANPVDVISTDRHTVKPWFQGKIPFTFSLPELTNSDFTLIGGRVACLRQTPGAQLIYQVRKHQISVFIFQDKNVPVNLQSAYGKQLSFSTESWNDDGLSYFAIGDANADDIHRLADLLRSAAKS
jgi:anti-sigma factor RsiW